MACGIIRRFELDRGPTRRLKPKRLASSGMALALLMGLAPVIRAEDPKTELAHNPRPLLPDGPSGSALPGNRISRTDRLIAPEVPAKPTKLVVPPTNTSALRAARTKAAGTNAKEVEFPNADDCLIGTIRTQIKEKVNPKVGKDIDDRLAEAGKLTNASQKLSMKGEITVILCPVRFATCTGGPALLKTGEIRAVTANLIVLGTEPKSTKVVPSIESAHLFLGDLGEDGKGKLVAAPERPPGLEWAAFRNAWADAGQLEYAFNGETSRVEPREDHRKHPLKSDDQLPHPFGLVKIQTEGENKSCCYLVPQGYYDFVPSESGAWDLAPSTFPFRIDNTKNPNPFVYSLGGERNLVPARQVDIVVGRYPRLQLSFRETETGTKPTERWVEAGTLNVQVADVGEFLVVTESHPKQVDRNEIIDSLDQSIIFNPSTEKAPVTYDVIYDLSDYSLFTRRYLGPGDAELHKLGGRPKLVARFSGGQGFAEKHRYVESGSYQFLEKPGDGWDLYPVAPYSSEIRNDTDQTIAFSCEEAYVITAGATRTVQSKFPITIFFDRGDGQGMARKTLPKELFGKPVARYRFVYDPKTSLFDVRP